MIETIQSSSNKQIGGRVSTARKVAPSRVDPKTAKSFTLEQQLEPFCHWVSEPIWVPPKDSSAAMAETMLSETRPFTSKEKRWAAVVEKHRAEFTQVREIDLPKASIRLPEGKFFVSVTERENFDQITDRIPACVQTRLEEFLAKYGNRRGVKVYYLKPLSVEVENQLILTTSDDLQAAIEKIQQEVFAEYRRQAIGRRARDALLRTVDLVTALPAWSCQLLCRASSAGD